ncbi:hypothetical protein D8I35_07085 [Corticibacter populi]|uniref:Mur ligase central domain-containing protein n=1 Tax=Corticibacter populi TaxID=1550736 RepID=A0A3M6QTF3_9BURK|nr:hypothetical protein [Corticibacter populi]RMX06306.1 hypothetical protein D8I35_07085 [Corticibacter populi]RZS32158.1 UDP-N-acetylmuramyl pentapeptide synthase [Corticibacter populi]
MDARRAGPSAAESALSQQLAQCRDHVARHVERLPEPYPGCVLFFSVAADDEDALVFHVRGTTPESAWREGATRIRQWAWARQSHALALRVDWVEDITSLPVPPRSGAQSCLLAMDAALALADAGLETAELLHRQLLARTARAWRPLSGKVVQAWPQPSHRPLFGGASTPALLLHLRGIFSMDGQAPISVPVPHSPWASPGAACRTAFVGADAPDTAKPHGCLSAARQLLLRQQSGGVWHSAPALRDHLGITCALLLAQQHAPDPAGQAGVLAALTALDDMQPQERQDPQDPLTDSMTLLTITQCIRHARVALAIPFDQAARLQTQAVRLTQRLQSWLARQPTLPNTAEHVPTLAWVRLALHGATPQPPCGHDTGTPPLVFIAPLMRQWQASPACLNDTWLSMGLHACVQELGGSTLQDGIDPHTLTQWRAFVRERLARLRQNTLRPELAIYLPARLRGQAVFLDTEDMMEDMGTRAAQVPSLVRTAEGTARRLLAQLASERLLALLEQALEQPPAAAGRTGTPATQQTGSLEPPAQPPMHWSAEALARHLGGQWVATAPPQQPAGCRGIDTTRAHHHPGAAVLVRRAGEACGVPPAALPALQPALLVSSSPQALPQAPWPLLHVPAPRLPAGLRALAAAARQRIHAPVIAVTGCAGKTSTARMIAHCLGADASARAAALLAQDTAIQMINWSEAAPCALVELPLRDLAADLPLIAPDVLIITNLPEPVPAPEGMQAADAPLLAIPPAATENGAATWLALAASLLPQAATLVFELRPELAGALPDAQAGGCRSITFGTHPQARLRQLRIEARQLHIQTDGQTHAITLQAHGRHMARDAQAVLAALRALDRPLEQAIPQLAYWQPLPGNGQPERLGHGMVLLDHSGHGHLLSIQAGLAQLETLAPQAPHRLVVLGSMQGDDHGTDAAMRLLAALVRKTPARRVLLHGEVCRGLVCALADLLHVNWYEDLNQLVCSLLRTMRAGDVVLVAGGPAANLCIAADAVRDNIHAGQPQESHSQQSR